MDAIIVQISTDLEPLIPRYLINRQADIQRLQEAVTHQNIDEIRSLGHTLKGSGTSFGLDAVSEFGRSLEIAAKAANMPEAQRLIDEFTLFLERLEVVYVDE
ncbi:MAG: Hpt domain-containing protein [Candidatus Kapaibacteriota bacterium]|jgi:HPt (histidine-containing phosphotransfer) domain-containing protein